MKLSEAQWLRRHWPAVKLVCEDEEFFAHGFSLFSVEVFYEVYSVSLTENYHATISILSYRYSKFSKYFLQNKHTYSFHEQHDKHRKMCRHGSKTCKNSVCCKHLENKLYLLEFFLNKTSRMK
jgi:hypothetical protein